MGDQNRRTSSGRIEKSHRDGGGRGGGRGRDGGGRGRDGGGGGRVHSRGRGAGRRGRGGDRGRGRGRGGGRGGGKGRGDPSVTQDRLDEDLAIWRAEQTGGDVEKVKKEYREKREAKKKEQLDAEMKDYFDKKKKQADNDDEDDPQNKKDDADNDDHPKGQNEELTEKENIADED